ncbi:hypothetical protein PR202_gb12024 [Eleusine coracana subsp. coracana]|uniref:F-box domain-containing protein n=1 Tax=Eleusine coracana subsp. coracana TaxID=191504 RepID=A0AAV5ENZ9_ELECO|nr:hypothetical protein PR202_gb12024 [Eleusine coracana subsp. coracana]
MAPPSPVLLDEMVEEILIRFPPADPARLVHAALACKSWRRLISRRRFRRRYLAFHHTAPMLGFLCNGIGWGQSETRFVPTSSFRPPRPHADHILRDWDVADARHGRILLHNRSLDRRGDPVKHEFMVWDPITDERRALPSLPGSTKSGAAVLCAAAAGNSGSCDHRDCRGGPTLVVFVGTTGRDVTRDRCFVRVYYSSSSSSEEESWSQPMYSAVPPANLDKIVPSALLGKEIHFVFPYSKTIFKYNLETREMSRVPRPSALSNKSIALMATEDGRLELTVVKRCRLSLWSREDGTTAGWALRRVVELVKLLPNAAFTTTPYVVGAADDGTCIIFLQTDDGTFTINLKSGQATKVCPDACLFPCDIFAYMSFCTPGTIGLLSPYYALSV